MQQYDLVRQTLLSNPKTWLITGVAGFIGSNLLEALLKLDQRVIGLDNFSTGFQRNLDEVQSLVTHEQWSRFAFIQGDIRDLDTCRRACEGAAIVLHQAAFGSVPRSIDDPIAANENNVSGFLNMLVAARDAGGKRFVYAASSATYGDEPSLPKVEHRIGKPLSPYGVTKYVNELYADVFSRLYGVECIGLRYFNVFGRRQDPNGAYAAVIPQWFAGFLRKEPVYINGDGKTTRDFCYIDNCIQANLLAACTSNAEAINQVFNVAFGQQTTLDELFIGIREVASKFDHSVWNMTPVYREFRPGDVRQSLADIGKAKSLLGYAPKHSLTEGLAEAAGWYVGRFQNADAFNRLRPEAQSARVPYPVWATGSATSPRQKS